MLIDWFTVGAQAVNFAVLVWLMKRYLYQPVLDAIDAREKHIATELADAAAKKAEAEHEQADFQAKNTAFDQQRAQLLATATNDAKTEGQRLSDEAAMNAAAATIKRQSMLKDEASALDRALGLRARQEIFAIARETLAHLAAVGLEEMVSNVFIERLRALEGTAKDRLAEAIGTTKDGVLVRSAFELPQPQREAIGHALNETFSVDVALRFETAPDLVAGIELTVNGQKLDWNIARYLESLGESVDALVTKPADVKPVPVEA